jgi:hypothetical protein
MARAPRSIPLRDPASAVLRCAPFRASLDVDPVGTAGAYDAFVCVEVPLPWERDITLSEPFRGLCPEPGRPVAALVGADGRRWRPVGLVPADDGDGGSVTVLALERPDGSGGTVVAPLVRSEWRVDAAEVAGLCRTLLAGGDRTAFESSRVDAGEVVDLLVCTHGRRDVCCGGLGTSLHRQLQERFAGEPGVRLWRCSHTGGHRFAPTALTFPDGYAWADLDEEVALAVVRRDRPAAEVAGRCRGSSLVPGGAAQAAERVGLELLGWAWAVATRTVAVVRDPAVVGGPTTVRLGGPLDVEVDVEVTASVPTPDCGSRDGPGEETEPVWGVSAVRPVSGASAQ